MKGRRGKRYKWKKGRSDKGEKGKIYKWNKGTKEQRKNSRRGEE